MRRGCFSIFGALAALAIIIGALYVLGRDYIDEKISPDPVTVAQASLQGLREQNRLSTFAARYVAVVTSRQSRLGLSARKTLIMPGAVRYEVDLAKLTQDNVRWDPEAKLLTVVLPEVEIMGPVVDYDNIREYGEGGILMTFTDAEKTLDAANRKAAQAELVRQAREPVPMKLARDATRRAVANNFVMPLRAAGIEAHVEVLFPNETSSRDTERWDTSRTPEEVLGNRQ